MRNKFLALATAFFLTTALGAGLTCACVSGDCHEFTGKVQVKMAQCHHGNTQAKAKEPARKDCCGKCQLEKKAILTGEAPLAGAILPEDAVADVPLFTATTPGTGHTVHRRRINCGPPTAYFTQCVLNFTFSFRAPPLG